MLAAYPDALHLASVQALLRRALGTVLRTDSSPGIHNGCNPLKRRGGSAPRHARVMIPSNPVKRQSHCTALRPLACHTCRTWVPVVPCPLSLAFQCAIATDWRPAFHGKVRRILVAGVCRPYIGLVSGKEFKTL